MFDLKVINAVLSQLEEERGIPKEKILEAIETALGTAYKKEYGKKGQIIKAKFNLDSGDVEFWQTKIVVDPKDVIMEDEEYDMTNLEEGEEVKIRYNPEHHILIDEAKLIKKDVVIDDEVTFPLEKKDDFGRIAAQTAKQVITQKMREAEKTSVMSEFGEKEGTIVSGTVERMERGIVYLDMGRAVGMLSYDEQIPGERFKQGERVRAYLFKVDETPRGIFLKLSRSHPKFLEKLFEAEVPEIATETVEIKAIAREAGSRSKVAVYSEDESIDPVGALVGQRGVRVTTIMSELGGEKIDVIEWSEDPAEFINEALSPAKIIEIEANEEEEIARVIVSEDQQSLAIGKGGQNVRLAAKLTGWKIDIESIGGDSDEESDEKSEDTKEEQDEVKDEAPEETKEVENNNSEEEEEKKTEEDVKDEEE
jgi:N utilization substance protein A